MDVACDVAAVLEPVQQFCQADRVGLEPVLGVFPARSDLALRREIHGDFGCEIVERVHQTVDVVVEIGLQEVEAVAPPGEIGQHDRRFFG